MTALVQNSSHSHDIYIYFFNLSIDNKYYDYSLVVICIGGRGRVVGWGE